MNPMILILTDALRSDYPKKFNMKFTQQMLSDPKSLVFSKITPSTGFCEIIEYLSGQNAADHGMLTQITAKDDWYRQPKMPRYIKFAEFCFKRTRRIPKIRGLVNIICDRLIRQYVDHEIYRVRYNIPLSILQYFRPTESQYKYTSPQFSSDSNVLTSLKKNNFTVDVDDFVQFNKINGTDDERIERLIEKITTDQLSDFTMIYIGYCEMAHFWEQSSKKLENLMSHMDSQLDRVNAALKTHVGDYNLTLLGDHGMVEVKRHYNIISLIDDLTKSNELKLGDDIIYFIDSTCLRIWYNPKISEKLREKFSAEVAQEIQFDLDLSQTEYLAKFIPEYGDQIFWLKPGAVFYPDFFGNTLNVGMHGYDGSAEDQQGLMVSIGTQEPAMRNRANAPLSEIHNVIEKHFST